MNKYMMATKAQHKLGDLSRDNESLCYIQGETDTHYIGYWVNSFGFINVEFPKDTTRELTQEEIDRWDGAHIAIGQSGYTLEAAQNA